MEINKQGDFSLDEISDKIMEKYYDYVKHNSKNPTHLIVDNNTYYILRNNLFINLQNNTINIDKYMEMNVAIISKNNNKQYIEIVG